MKSSLSSAGSSAGKAIYSSFFILHSSLKNESPPPFCDGLKTKPRSKRHFPIGNAPAQPVTK